jgi:hypothetical protein
MKTIERATAPRTSTAVPAVEQHTFLQPAGFDLVTRRDLMVELVRWPLVLMMPASIALLTWVGLHAPTITIVPAGAALATIATVAAARRTSARAAARRAVAVIPWPRAGS